MPRKRVISLESAELELWRQSIGKSSGKLSEKLVLQVIGECLTETQSLYLNDYYFCGKTMYEIASERNVSVSTVSRTVSRAERRIFKALKYCVRR